MKKDLPNFNFECTQCGTCCRLAYGYVFISKDEQKKIADHLGMAYKDFKKKYVTYMMFAGTVLKWNYDDGACLFLEGNSCRIYTVRPGQCSSYPRWKRLNKKKELEHVKTYCKGFKD